MSLWPPRAIAAAMVPGSEVSKKVTRGLAVKEYNCESTERDEHYERKEDIYLTEESQL